MHTILQRMARFVKTVQGSGQPGRQQSQFAVKRRFSWRLQRVEQLEERTLLSIGGFGGDDGLAPWPDLESLFVAEIPEPSVGSQMLAGPASPDDFADSGSATSGGLAGVDPPSPLGPTVMTSWDAANFQTNRDNTGGYAFIPPDPIGAAGPNHVVNVTNVTIEWYTKAGVLGTSQSLKDFFTPMTPVNFTFDPKVIYDQHEDRFVVVTLERQDTSRGDPANTSRILVAASDTSDPTGSWSFQAIDSKINIGGSDTWADYPGLAVDEEAIYITNNMFGFGAGSFGGVRLWIIDKGVGGGLYAGGNSTVTVHDPYAGGGVPVTTQPAHIYGNPGGIIGTYLVGYSGLSMDNPGDPNGVELVQIFRVDDPLGIPAFVGQMVNVGDIEDTRNPLPDAPQLGTSTEIETNDRRALNAVWRDDMLYATAEIMPGAGHPDAGQVTAHWFRLDTTVPAAIVVDDQGDVGGENLATGAFTFFPSITVDQNSNMAIGFSISAPNIFAGAAFTGRLADDAPGTTQPSAFLAEGLAPYVRTFGSGRNRWGDYSGISLDPLDETTFWAYNEYAWSQSGTAPEDGRWSTRWGSFTLEETPEVDYGDAPDTGTGTGMDNYNTLSGDNGPSHTIVPTIKMGANIDGESDGQPGVLAEGDDLGGTDDEDGLTNYIDDLFDLHFGKAPSVRVNVTNNTGSAAILYGWIDYNGNGIFENATERTSVGVPHGTTASTVTLNFHPVPSDAVTSIYARFRLSTDAAAQDPTGPAADGEVEDYLAVVIDPRVVSVVRADPNPTAADSVNFTVTFSDGVTGVDAADFIATTSGSISGVSVTAVSSAGGSNVVYTVTVGTGSGHGMILLEVIDDDTIQNGAGDPLGGPGVGNGDYNDGETYDVVANLNDHSLESYTGQDTPPPPVMFTAHAAAGTSAIEDGGASLHLTGNAWKAWPLALDVTPDTILEFDYASSVQGEIQAIGFTDNLVTINPDWWFQLYGTQTLGQQDYRNYSGTGSTHYRIRVGDYFTGPMTHITFINDHDDPPSNADEVFSYIRVFENGLSPIDFNNFPVGSYGGPGQDVDGTYSVDSLHVWGNSWKSIPVSYTVTADTILEFDYRSDIQGEIQGIGLDDDLVISPDRVFQLYGTQTWGIQDHRDYSGSGSQHYVIRVGDFFTGPIEHMTFINDHDSAPSNADEIFSNVSLFEAPQSPVDFRYVNVGSYGGSNQDVTGNYSVEDEGAALYLSGNTWKSTDFSYNVTSNTKMTFDYQSSVEGEIEAIGLDDDLVISPDRVFQLYGTQTWGIQDFKNYAATAPGWKSYEIPVGDFFTGAVNYITFINDHDSSNPNALGVFKNVKVFENPPPSLPENSVVASFLAEDPASIWRPDPALGIDGATRAYDHFYGNHQSQASLIDNFYGDGQSQTGSGRGAAFAHGPVAIGPENGKNSSRSPASSGNPGYGRSSSNDTIRDRILEGPRTWGDLGANSGELELLYEIMAVDRCSPGVEFGLPSGLARGVPGIELQ